VGQLILFQVLSQGNDCVSSMAKEKGLQDLSCRIICFVAIEKKSNYVFLINPGCAKLWTVILD
jgi:hypothetical protein